MTTQRSRTERPVTRARKSTPARRGTGSGRHPLRPAAAGDGFRFRHRVGGTVMFALLAIAIIQLLNIQLLRAPALSAESAGQRSTTTVLAATRGTIYDRNGEPLAFTTPAYALTFQPQFVRDRLETAKEKDPSAPDPDTRLKQIADGIASELGSAVDRNDLLDTITGDGTFAYLAKGVDPQIADRIVSDFPEVGRENQDVRQYPAGALAANIIGTTRSDGPGLMGLESSLDSVLAGTDGQVTYDRGSDGSVIPGSERDKQDAINGSSVELTLDSDVQFYVQQQVQRAKDLSGAQDASAVVLDAHTGQVLAMSNDSTFDPSVGVAANPTTAEFGNLPVTTPFEPGSVNKIITAAAAIEDGVATPDEVLQVPGSIYMSGITVNDAWAHGLLPYTVAGIFGKSSNVGTLMLAQRVGEDRYAQMLNLFGLGQRTDVGLPGESAGMVPSRDQWSGGTFANLPIGQGLSMTLLQMTDIYQTIANDGVRVPPRIIDATIDANGNRTPEPAPEGIRVVSPETAAAVRNMFRAVVQSDTGNQQGTGPQAAVAGYQIAGKTGTAQQVDPACGCYSSSRYWITFAGIAPADDPRYVIGIMLNAPTRSSNGSGGQSAAPLFHDIASWLLRRDAVPLSPEAPPLLLQAD